jgi:hypothetical protein
MVRIRDRELVRSRLRWIIVAAGTVVLVVFLASGAMQPVAAPATTSGATHVTPGGDAGVDLVCGGGIECGPDNPAIGVAPSPVIGPKVQP